MNSVIEQWKAQLGALSPAERAELAHFLLASLDAEAEHVIEAEWDREASRRVAEIRSGNATGRSVDDLLSELRGRDL
ncbi:addiction module protein [Tautonia rosea]|uniref:addiction module protein n=1 Tax=Tautonia rosea TaxID=2728037 RepID=UPI0014734FA8|nr:addiction module protein [Tautonia rosea]